MEWNFNILVSNLRKSRINLHKTCKSLQATKNGKLNDGCYDLRYQKNVMRKVLRILDSCKSMGRPNDPSFPTDGLAMKGIVEVWKLARLITNNLK